jgi:hypothetical protein
MLKLVFKLAVTALLANAAYRVGSEYLAYIRFRDEVRDAAMFKAHNDEELTKRIMDLAGEYDLPLAESAIDIRRDERRVSVAGSYDKSIEIVPTFFYPWHFSWSIDATVSIVIPPFAPRERPR